MLYNCACAFAVAGEKDRAIACLEKAARGGWGHRDWILHDTDLDSLREDPRFSRVLELLSMARG